MNRSNRRARARIRVSRVVPPPPRVVPGVDRAARRSIEANVQQPNATPCVTLCLHDPVVPAARPALDERLAPKHLGGGREVDFSIRQATSGDAETVAHLLQRAFRDVAERFGLGPENAPTHPSNCQPNWIRSDLARGVVYYLLSTNGPVAGCVALEFASSSLAYLERLGVPPDRRGRGFGTALLRHALYQARSAGATVVSAGVIAEHSELVSWYERLGFAHAGTRRFRHLPFTVAYLEHRLS